jgi:site-specific DNA-methyltransferase (adenine-specific)
LTRIILASTQSNAWILDPFAGASTTGIAANLLDRKFVGIDSEEEYLELSRNRKLESESPFIQKQFREVFDDYQLI